MTTIDKCSQATTKKLCDKLSSEFCVFEDDKCVYKNPKLNWLNIILYILIMLIFLYSFLLLIYIAVVKVKDKRAIVTLGMIQCIFNFIIIFSSASFWNWIPLITALVVIFNAIFSTIIFILI